MSELPPGLSVAFSCGSNGFAYCVRKRWRAAFCARSNEAQRIGSANVAGCEPMADCAAIARRKHSDCLVEQRARNRVIRDLIRTIRMFGPAEMPRLAEVDPESSSPLGFAVVVSQIRGSWQACGPHYAAPSLRILPALQSAGPRSAGQFSSRSRRILIVAEIAAAMAPDLYRRNSTSQPPQFTERRRRICERARLTLRLAPPVHQRP